jgi:signal transduction histidine kinase
MKPVQHKTRSRAGAAIFVRGAHEVAHARTAERQVQFLAEIGHLFHASLDIAQVLEQVLIKSSEVLGESNCIFLREGDELRLAALHHPDPARAGQLRAFYSQNPARLGEGIVGCVAESGQPVCLSGLSPEDLSDLSSPAYRAFMAQSAPATFLAVPLVASGQVIGVFCSASRVPGRRFTLDDLKLAQAIAERAAVAIENARLYRELQERLRQQTILYEASVALSSAASLNDVLNTLSRHLCLALNLTGVGVSLAALSRNRIVPTQVYDTSGLIAVLDEVTGELYQRLSTALEAASPAGQPGKPPVLALRADQPQISLEERALLEAFGAQALLIIPLVVRGESLGLLELCDSRAPRQFSAEETVLAQALAHQAAVALENVHLLESLQATYDELQESSRLKDEFIQNVSHELRTPLTFVKGYIELLREGAFGPLSDEAHHALNVVADKTGQIIRLVERIATLHLMTQQKLNLEPLDLNRLAQEAAERFRPVAEQAGLNLHLELTPAPAPVMGDPLQLPQVFDCLLENAIKFSPQGSWVALRVHSRPGVAWVEVEDNGIGIPPDKLDKVWTPFYQVEGHMKRRFGGAGVGLAVVKRVIQAHGGHVWANSQLGQGCTFGFALRRLDAGM